MKYRVTIAPDDGRQPCTYYYDAPAILDADNIMILGYGRLFVNGWDIEGGDISFTIFDTTTNKWEPFNP